MRLLWVTCALALAVFTTPASAQWKGCYVGVSAGMSATSTQATLNVSPPISATAVNALDLDGLASSGGVVGVLGGCDLRIDKLVVGAFADYQWHNQKWAISSGLIPGPLASMEIDTQWTIGGRAGIAFTEKTLVYGLVGWTKMETTGIAIPIVPTTLALPSFQGWSLGGGIETEIMPNIRLGAEYRYTRFDKETITPLPGLSVGMQPEMHTAMGRISYAFEFFK